jgi:LAGLIDADG endonuclease
MLLRVVCHPSEAEGRARGPTVVFALPERARPEALGDLKAFFECGWIRESRSDRTFKYEARSVQQLLGRVVPHFELYPLRGVKRHSFRGFAKVCQMIGQGDHLRPEGMAEIVRIAYEMNLGKRRHSASALLRTLSEVKG